MFIARYPRRPPSPSGARRDYKCASNAPGAVAQGDDGICAGCLEKERRRYAKARYSYLPMPEERDGR